MARTDWIADKVDEIAGKLQGCSRCEVRRLSAGKRRTSLPGRKEVHDALDTLIGILFPGCHGHGPFASGPSDESIHQQLNTTVISLQDEITRALSSGEST